MEGVNDCRACDRAYVWFTFIACLLTLQEHYMASLMPLQKNITPWKVESRDFWGRVNLVPIPRREGLRQMSTCNREGS